MPTSAVVPGERIPRVWVKLASAAATDTSDGSKDDPVGGPKESSFTHAECARVEACLLALGHIYPSIFAIRRDLFHRMVSHD